MTTDFGLESLNQKLQIPQLLAKLPDRAFLSLDRPGDEEPATLADQQDERTRHVAARVGDITGARELRDRLPQLVSVHGVYSDNRRVL